VALAFLLSLAIAYGLRMQWISRIFLGTHIFYFLFASTFVHHGLALWFRSEAQHGANRGVLLLVGSGQQARDVAQRILDHRELGVFIRGFFEDEMGFDPAEVEAMQRLGVPHLGGVNMLIPFAQREVADGVLFAVDTRRLGRMEDLFLQCEDLGLDTLVAANLFPHLVAKVQLEHLQEIPLLRYTTVPHSPIALAFKRFIDIAGAAAGLLLLSPLLAGVAAIVKMSDGGSVFFRQERVGLNGRRFTLIKYRTMVVGADKMKAELMEHNEADGPVFKIRNDPRVTRLGRFLRKSSMDELPQLWNVLKGEMSLVGPRPPIPSEVDLYERWQRRRLSMRPGLTCLWQISGRSELDFDSWMKLDLHYIDHWSLTLDLIILLKTIPAVLSTRGAA
jgi:exopolysaccharide biosynthesis polyprenyl glycosylphosphotransferase